MQPRLAHIIDRKTRLKMLGGTLLAVAFLSIYNRQVCPFINGLHVFELIFNLLGVLVVQLGLREWLFARATPKPNRSLARQGYQLSMVSWVVAGVVASLVHYLRYPAFPMGSHVKLLSSYWVLGAGILAQWEYAILESAERGFRQSLTDERSFLEQVSRRIIEGYLIFSLGPVVFMLMVVVRFQLEGYFSGGVSAEVAYIGIFCVVTAALVAIRFTRGLSEDTKAMIKGLRQIEQGEFDARLAVRRSDEFGEMSDSINHMAKGLQQRERIQEAFGRFVDPQVAEAFIEKHIRQDQALQMGGERRQVVILMSDIRDFTPLSESMPAEDLIYLLNGYFTEMVTAITEHGGVVDKFIGDAVMAVFGLLDEGKQPALAAVRAAEAMQERLARYNQSLDGPPIRTGIGIHSGEVVAGYLGSAQRLEYTVIGSPVNIAARIEFHARGERPALLFSQEIADAVAGDMEVVEVFRTPLKGVSEEMTLFSLPAFIKA